MNRAFPLIAAGLLSVATATACSTAAKTPAQTPASAPSLSAADIAAGVTHLPGFRQPFSNADVHFMSGMIPHHAQAIIMAGWAPSHGARTDVRILCERIVVGQGDEIQLMQTWLRDRGLPVPDAKATHMKMEMNGMTHDMLMPGMLSEEEMAALGKARGPEFDRLFLIGMIKHHQGAIDMVEELMKSHGAAQDDDIYKFASDVYADQSTEIERMTKMLEVKGRS